MFESLKAVGVVVAFLVPGYLWRITEGQLVYLDRKLEWQKFALGLLTRCTIIYLPWSPILYRGWKQAWYDSAPWATLLICILIAVVMPLVCGTLWGLFRQRGWDRNLFALLGLKTFEHNPAPTAWDAMFPERHESWIIITLKDNTRVQGWFGVGSHASSQDDQRDLFVSHILTQRTDGQKEFVKNTGGVYISASEIKTIEFINDDDQKT
ncbi:MAG: DUF6338 family protein [Limisphaerales bacterium]